jgi:hypothetical protein
MKNVLIIIAVLALFIFAVLCLVYEQCKDADWMTEKVLGAFNRVSLVAMGVALLSALIALLV